MLPLVSVSLLPKVDFYFLTENLNFFMLSGSANPSAALPTSIPLPAQFAIH